MLWEIKKVVKLKEYNYAYVPEHPKATKDGYVLEHRIIMENSINRILTDDEIVHHIDLDKRNNSIDNLKLMTNSEHSKYHTSLHGRLYVRLLCPTCNKEFEIPKNNSYLNKHNKLNCTCCSKSCRGKLTRSIQLNGFTDEIKEKINSNFVNEFKKYNNE